MANWAKKKRIGASEVGELVSTPPQPSRDVFVFVYFCLSVVRLIPHYKEPGARLPEIKY